MIPIGCVGVLSEILYYSIYIARNLFGGKSFGFSQGNETQLLEVH